MIYSNWGCQLTITGDCGEHKVKGYPRPVRLVRADRLDDKAVRYYFAQVLRADEGTVEVNAAITAAPKVSLTKAELKDAVSQAS